MGLIPISLNDVRRIASRINLAIYTDRQLSCREVILKELDEIIGDVIYKAEECVNDGTHWVRARDFSDIADKLIAINKKLSEAPGNAQQQVQADSDSITELETAIATIRLTDGGISAIKHIRIAIGILIQQAGKE